MLNAWETVSPKNELSKIQELLKFLERRFKIIKAVETLSKINIRGDKNTYNKNNSKKTKNNQNYKSVVFATTGYMKCYKYQLAHSVYKCPSFLGLPVPDRIRRVDELK